MQQVPHVYAYSQRRRSLIKEEIRIEGPLCTRAGTSCPGQLLLVGAFNLARLSSVGGWLYSDSDGWERGLAIYTTPLFRRQRRPSPSSVKAPICPSDLPWRRSPPSTVTRTALAASPFSVCLTCA